MSRNCRTIIISFHIPVAMLEALDRMIEMGVFNNRSEAIRLALYKLLSEQASLMELVGRRLQVGYR